jgi:hypothetical protein
MVLDNGYSIAPKVPDEWVKQLVHDIIGKDFDFAHMIIYRNPFQAIQRFPFIESVGLCMRHRFNIMPKPSVEICIGIVPCMMEVDIEEVDLQKIVDPLNGEVHWIGYGPKSNKVVIAELRL